MDRAVPDRGSGPIPLQRARNLEHRPRRLRVGHAARGREPARQRRLDRRPRRDLPRGEGRDADHPRIVRHGREARDGRAPGRDASRRGQARLQRGERVTAGSRTDDQPGAGAGQPRDPQGSRRGGAHGDRGRGVRRRARQPRARRGRALQLGARRVQGRARRDPPPALPRGDDRDPSQGATGLRGRREPEGHAAVPLARIRNGAGAGREAAMKGVLAVIPLLLVAGLIFLASGSLYYQVDEGEQAIVSQFGRPIGDPITEPGLYWKLPFIQEVRRFEKRILTWDGDPNQIPTKGREFIWVDTTARWKIVDPRKFLESVATEQGARSRLDDIIDSVVRDQVSSSELAELVRSADWKVPEREVLEKEAATAEQEAQLKKQIIRGREEITRTILTEASRLMPQYGIELVDVRFKRLNYIESVREKVYARMISERKRIAAQFRSEGEVESARTLGTMEKELRDIRSSAYRRAQEIRGKADAEATTIYGGAYG